VRSERGWAAKVVADLNQRKAAVKIKQNWELLLISWLIL
jgi:hypothetical protein